MSMTRMASEIKGLRKIVGMTLLVVIRVVFSNRANEQQGPLAMKPAMDSCRCVTPISQRRIARVAHKSQPNSISNGTEQRRKDVKTNCTSVDRDHWIPGV